MTPVGVFFICQNEDKCHFVNSTKMSQGYFAFFSFTVAVCVLAASITS